MLSTEKRCVTTQVTAAKETSYLFIYSLVIDQVQQWLLSKVRMWSWTHCLAFVYIPWSFSKSVQAELCILQLESYLCCCKHIARKKTWCEHLADGSSGRYLTLVSVKWKGLKYCHSPSPPPHMGLKSTTGYPQVFCQAPVKINKQHNKPILCLFKPLFPDRRGGATSSQQEGVIRYIWNLICSDCTNRFRDLLWFVITWAENKNIFCWLNFHFMVKSPSLSSVIGKNT